MPQNDQIWPKIGIFGQFWPGHAGLFNALLWVGWWLWRGLYLARHLFTLFYHSGNPNIWTKKLFFTLCIFRLGCFTLAPLVKLLKVFTLKKSGAIVRQAEKSTTGSTTLLILCQIVSVSVNHTKIERNRFSLA